MPRKPLNYTKCAVIVHGKSEFYLVRYIYTNLHLRLKIIARDKGNTSIQITGLKAFLRKKQFKTRCAFANAYEVEYDKKSKSLQNFKLFIIMDTDDCEDEKMIEDYISGALFHGHSLEEYVVPIYNKSNLEDIMLKAGIIPTRVPSSQRGTYYNKIFPLNSDPLGEDTIKQVTDFADKLQGIKGTNLLLFVEYCLGLLERDS